MNESNRRMGGCILFKYGYIYGVSIRERIQDTRELEG